MDPAILTIKDMIFQRGYKTTESDDEKIIGINKDGENIVVFIQPVAKLNIDRVKEYISLLDKMKINHCIVIYTESVTSMTKKLIENSVDIKIEIFTQQELQYNITKHRLVPKHIKLSDDEAKEFKKKHGLKHPAIIRSDPVSRFYDFKRGDVVKIVRMNGEDEFITYRIVKG